MKTEPALIIGTVASIIVIIGQQLLASGIVTSTGALNVLNLVVSTVPLIAAAIIRAFVTPANPGQ